MNTTAITTTEAQALSVHGADYAALITYFLASTDAASSSRNQYGRALRQFFAWIERTGRRLDALTRADVIAFRDGLINGDASEDGKPKATLTAAGYVTAVKLFYTWLEAVKAYPNIAAGVKLPKRTKKFEREPLSNHQAAELMAAAANCGSLRDNAIINLLTRNGLRTIEIVRANVEDVQTKGGETILLIQGKGHASKDNFVILSGKTRRAISDYLATRPDAAPDAPLFVSESDRNNGGRLTTRTISAIAKRELCEIGLTSRKYTAHSLRHTCACVLLEKTNDYNLVQLTLRHSNPATTQIYTYHIDERRRLKAANAVDTDKLF